MEPHEVTNTVLCPHCGFLSPADGDGMPLVGATFLYFNNHKSDQPRFHCLQCGRNFTVGWHGRPRGRTYAKKRNVDPAEFLGVHRQCPKCGMHDNAPFKFYNNQNKLRPHFQCKSCRVRFQMWVEHDETTGAVRLVHSGRDQCLRKSPRTKRAQVGSAPHCSGGSVQWTPPPPRFEQSGAWMSDEDATFATMLEADLCDEAAIEEFADPPPTCPSEDFSKQGDCNVLPAQFSFGDPDTCSAFMPATMEMDPRLCRPFQSPQQPDEVCNWQVPSDEYSSSSSSEQQEQRSFVQSLEEFLMEDDFDDGEQPLAWPGGAVV